MTKLVINAASQKLLTAYLNNPAHALCLSGDEGVGLGSIAVWLAEELSDTPQTITHIAPEKGLISIDRIRQLYEQTRSIQAGKRCVIIDDADAMSVDAQNALLKLLEEPVENIHFILTTHHLPLLLATITSRAQTITILHISEGESKKMLETYSLDSTKLTQTLFMASGRPAELTRLAHDADYLTSKVGVVTDARTFLQASTYERLTVIKKYTDRSGSLEFLTACAKLLSFSLVKQRNFSVAESMEIFDLVMKRIEANGHVRTHLMYLVTKLP